MISSSQRLLPDNTKHSQQTDFHAPGGIGNHNLSKRAAVDLRLIPRGHSDLPVIRLGVIFASDHYWTLHNGLVHYRDLYLTTHPHHTALKRGRHSRFQLESNWQYTSSEGHQTHALDRAATEIRNNNFYIILPVAVTARSKA